MVSTRGGASYVPLPSHYGAFAKKYSTLSGQKRIKTKSRSTERQRQKFEDERREAIRRLNSAANTPNPNNHATTRSSNRVTGGGRVTCSHYGPNRQYLFPGYFFCNPCSLWDSVALSNRASSAQRDSTRHLCTAAHTSATHPTMKSTHWDRTKSQQTTVFTNNPSLVDTPGEANVSIDVVNQILDNGSFWKELADSRQRRINQLLLPHAAHTNATNNHNTPKALSLNMVCSQVKQYLAKKKAASTDAKSLQRIANKVLKSLFSEDEIGQYIFQSSLNISKKHFRENVFTPWGILQKMDMNPISNYQSLQQLRSVENLEKRERNSMIPSTGAIQRCAKVVESYGDIHCPMIFGRLSEELGGGEYVRFDIADVIRIILPAFGLEETAKERSVFISQALDGLQISRNISSVNYVLKVQDLDACDPWTKEPAYDDNFSKKCSLQSNQMVVPVVSVIGRETKQLTQEAFTKEFRTMEKEGNIALLKDGSRSSILGDGYFPITSAVNCDMKVTQNGLGRGGAYKVREFACHACTISKMDVVKPNNLPCDRWCSHWAIRNENIPDDEKKFGGKCYHREWLSSENHEKLVVDKEEAEALITTYLGGYDQMMQLKKISKIASNEDPSCEIATTDYTSLDSIFFKYEDASQGERMVFFNSVMHDLRIRDAPYFGKNWEEKVSMLRDYLHDEYRLTKLKENLDHSTLGRADALFILENNVPCVLHMENRVSLKILNLLLKEAVTRARSGITFKEISATNEGARLQALVSAVEDYINSSCLGTHIHRTSWKFPLDEKKNLYDLSLSNGECRRLLIAMDGIIETCQVEKPQLWLTCTTNYRKAMGYLLSKRDLSDDDVKEYQWYADLFFGDWVLLTGKEGQTNYVHLIGSGHVADYLYRWKNLYQHSNQGFECWNKMWKRYYRFRTQRGGSVGNKTNESTRSRLLPLGRWLQRRLVWMANVPYEDMKKEVAGRLHDDTVQLATDLDGEEEEL